jgi:hypothetical protein
MHWIIAALRRIFCEQNYKLRESDVSAHAIFAVNLTAPRTARSGRLKLIPKLSR